ncbi:hypothetical protein ABZP36_014940 [Zizania latifolia]
MTISPPVGTAARTTLASLAWSSGPVQSSGTKGIGRQAGAEVEAGVESWALGAEAWSWAEGIPWPARPEWCGSRAREKEIPRMSRREELRWNEMLTRRYQGREGTSLVDLFISQEIYLLSDCLNAPADEFGEACIQA